MDAESSIVELLRHFRQHGPDALNEAATRLLYIDKILRDVLGWPVDGFNPEEYTQGEEGEREWIDYHLQTTTGARLIVEAKRAGRTFQMPTTRKSRTLRLKTLRSSHGGDLGAAIKQAVQYAHSTGTYPFVVTNGWQWIASVAFWPNVKPDQLDAVLYYDLEDIHRHLQEFTSILSPDGVRCDHLLFKVLGAETLRPSFAASLNSSLHYNPPQNKNYLSAPIEALMRNYFADLQTAPGTDLLERCYVANDLTESYVARLESFVGNTLPYGYPASAVIDRQKFDRNPAQDRFTKAIRSSGEVLYLVGRIGSGKTSFILFAMNELRKRVPNDTLMIFHLDLLNTTQLVSRQFDHDKLRNELAGRLLAQAEAAYPDVSPFDYETLKGMFSAELQREIASMPPSMRESDAAAVRIDQVLRDGRKDRFMHALRYLSHLRTNRNVPVAVILDNIDRGTEEFERFCVLFARRLSSEAGATIVVALRDTTYHAGKRGGFMDVSQNVVFTITPPPFLSVVSRRVEYTRRRWNNDPDLMLRVQRHLQGYPLSAVESFIEVLAELLLGGRSRELTDAIQALAGTNVRLGLELLRLFATSGNTDIERLLREYNKDYYHQSVDVFLRAVMRGDLARYEEEGKPIINLFQVAQESVVSHFSMIRVLQFLSSMANNPRTDTDVPVQEVVGNVSMAAGHFGAHVRAALDHLGRFGLILSRSQPEPPWDPDSVVRVTAAGMYYLETLLYNREYLKNVVDDTVLYDARVHDAISHVHRESAPWPEKQEKKMKLFLNYLWSREHGETVRTTATTGAGWLRPISLEIAQSVFGAKFTNEIMRSRRFT